MTIEQEIFASYVADTNKLIEYGFEKLSNVYIFSKDFLNGDFKALITINEHKEVDGKVIENAFNEEYSQLRVESLHGEFIGMVRETYKELLIDIRDKCFTKQVFVSSQANRVAKLIYDRYGESPDFPFASPHIKNYGVFRFQGNKKWYGLIMNVSKAVFNKAYKEEYVDVINVRIDENKRDSIINNTNIFPSYHMNKKKWVSIILDESLSDETVMSYIDYSRNYMVKKARH